MRDRILVTGATGFVGAAVVDRLVSEQRPVRGAIRRPSGKVCKVEVANVGDIGPNTDWRAALGDIDCVIHCAARPHVLHDETFDRLDAYRQINVAGTQRLAEHAVECGVRRIVFVSSIKVNGERTEPGTPFSVSDIAAPEDAYGQSKWEAERALHGIAARTGLEVVIVRPPLIYGPGVKGSFPRLLQLIRRGIPLPLGAVDNQRSLVALDNLVDLLVCCIDHPAAQGETFLVSDGEDLSTLDLVSRQCKLLGRPVHVIWVPIALLRIVGRLLGRSNEVNRLLDSLQVDISHTRLTLGWKPPISVDEGLSRALAHVVG